MKDAAAAANCSVPCINPHSERLPAPQLPARQDKARHKLLVYGQIGLLIPGNNNPWVGEDYRHFRAGHRSDPERLLFSPDR